MYTLTANDAKRNFGELLLNAQREPIKISKNSKDAVVVMSIKDYEEFEAMKANYITHCFKSAKDLQLSLRTWNLRHKYNSRAAMETEHFIDSLLLLLSFCFLEGPFKPRAVHTTPEILSTQSQAQWLCTSLYIGLLSTR